MAFWFIPANAYWIIMSVWSVASAIHQFFEAHEKLGFVYRWSGRFINFVLPSINPGYTQPLDRTTAEGSRVSETGGTTLTPSEEQQLRRRSFTKTRGLFRTITLVIIMCVLIWFILWMATLLYNMVIAAVAANIKYQQFREKHGRHYANCKQSHAWMSSDRILIDSCDGSKGIVDSNFPYPWWTEWWTHVYENQHTYIFFRSSDVAGKILRAAGNGWINFFISAVIGIVTLIFLVVVVDLTEPDDTPAPRYKGKEKVDESVNGNQATPLVNKNQSVPTLTRTAMTN